MGEERQHEGSAKPQTREFRMAKAHKLPRVIMIALVLFPSSSLLKSCSFDLGFLDSQE